MSSQHTVAKAVILNEKNQVLVLRRSEFPAYPARSHTPDLPGGLVDPGESEHQAVIREIKEETSIVVNPDDVKLGFTHTYFYESVSESVSKLLYVVRLDYTPEVQISWEHEAYVWHNLETVFDEYVFSEFYQDGIAYLRQYILA